MRDRIRILAMLVALLSAAAYAGDGERVKGVGYASPTQPPLTDDPPPEFTDPTNGHDVERGTSFCGTECYELRQGARDDNKVAWAETDFIHWHAHGATLDAEGRIQDMDPDEATIASAEAWGEEQVTAIVSLAEGDHGSIEAENRISFSYDYLISGNSIGEASVQLQGAAFDLTGKRHDFDLSDQRSEGVEQEREEKHGFRKESYAKLRAYVANSPRGSSAGLGAELGGGKEEHSSLRVSITRRFAQAGGDNGATPPLVISEEVSGPTPLERQFVVCSDGSVVLRARAGRGPGSDGDSASAVVVDLREFEIENTLRVWKSATVPTVEPGDAEPPPSFPEEEGPETPADPPPPPTQSEEGVDTEPEERKPPAPTRRDAETERAPIPRFPGIDAFGRVRWPRGVLGERGSLPGRLEIGLTAPPPCDLVFLVAPAAEGWLELAGRRELVVPAGRCWGSLPFHAESAGTAGVVLTLLDENGAATGWTATVEVRTRSVDTYPETRLWVAAPGKAWWPDRDLALRVLRGRRAGPLRVGRLGYGGLDCAATVVGVEVDDPDGILAPLPASVAIPAGETHVALPLDLNDREGLARIAFASGPDRVEVAVVSRTQSWDDVRSITAYEGTVTPVPVSLHYGERDARTVRATLEGPACAEILEGDDTLTLRAGENTWFVRLQGLAVGKTTLVLRSEGLEPLEIPIEVIPPVVGFSENILRINHVPLAVNGEIHLWTPPQVRIASIELPAGSEDYLVVEGLGTPWVILRIAASPDMPASLALPVTFGGDLSEPFQLGLFDILEERDENAPLVSVHFGVP